MEKADTEGHGHRTRTGRRLKPTRHVIDHASELRQCAVVRYTLSIIVWTVSCNFSLNFIIVMCEQSSNKSSDEELPVCFITRSKEPNLQLYVPLATCILAHFICMLLVLVCQAMKNSKKLLPSAANCELTAHNKITDNL